MTNNKQQTAVEWYASKIHTVVNNTTDASNFSHEELLEQAKAMEKERMIEFAINYTYGTKRVGTPLKEDFIKLYEQTYGGGDK